MLCHLVLPLIPELENDIDINAECQRYSTAQFAEAEGEKTSASFKKGIIMVMCPANPASTFLLCFHVLTLFFSFLLFEIYSEHCIEYLLVLVSHEEDFELILRIKE